MAAEGACYTMDLDVGSYDWDGAIGGACPGGHLGAFLLADTRIALKGLIAVRSTTRPPSLPCLHLSAALETVGKSARVALRQLPSAPPATTYGNWEWVFPGRTEAVVSSIGWDGGQPDDGDMAESGEEQTALFDFRGDPQPWLADVPAAEHHPVLCMYGPARPVSGHDGP